VQYNISKAFVNIICHHSVIAKVQIYQRQNLSNTNMRNKKVVIRREKSQDKSCPLTGPK
jgi:hypothetical protein